MNEYNELNRKQRYQIEAPKQLGVIALAVLLI